MEQIEDYTGLYHLKVFFSTFAILIITYGLTLFVQLLVIQRNPYSPPFASGFVLLLVTLISIIAYYVMSTTDSLHVNKPRYALSTWAGAIVLSSVFVESQKLLIEKQLFDSQAEFFYIFTITSMVIVLSISILVTVYSTIPTQDEVEEEGEK